MRRPQRRAPLSARDRGVLGIERAWGPGPSSPEHKLAEAKRDLGLDERG